MRERGDQDETDRVAAVVIMAAFVATRASGFVELVSRRVNQPRF